MHLGSELNVERKKSTVRIDEDMLWDSGKLAEFDRLTQTGLKINYRNPYFSNIPGYRRGGLLYQHSEEEIEEIKKCAFDPIYFAEKYCQTMTDQGIRNIVLHPHQKRILNEISSKDRRWHLLLAARQSMKCLNFNSNITIKNNNEIKKIPIGLFYLQNKTKLTFTEKIKKILYYFYIYFDREQK